MAMVVPRGEGVSTKLIRTSYSASAGTAFVIFDNVRVPNDFVITDSDGVRVILSNFNHERFVRSLGFLVSCSHGFQMDHSSIFNRRSADYHRGVFEVSIVPHAMSFKSAYYKIRLHHRWVNQRYVFGKPLSSQAVIRSKLAAMISRVESSQNWLENISYQMTHMSYAQQATDLAG